MIDDRLQQQLGASRRVLQELIRRGGQIRDQLATDEIAVHAVGDNRVWQRDCAAAINQLSGGSKAHWLARAYSAAFLVRSTDGSLVIEAEAPTIVDRILEVLRQADRSLRMDGVAPASASASPVVRRFDFVRNVQLRPVLEQALVDSARALEEGDFKSALMTSCVILEAIISDALWSEENEANAASCAADGNNASAGVADWSFDTRIAAAEKAGLIRGGCARLPPVARAYRDPVERGGVSASEVVVSAREARLVRQVLHVVMRDLDPGR